MLARTSGTAKLCSRIGYLAGDELARRQQSIEIAAAQVDTAFADVVRACGDPRRPGGWIDDRILDAYARLHEMGWAHSVEARLDGRLVGGLYGVRINGFFAGRSFAA